MSPHVGRDIGCHGLARGAPQRGSHIRLQKHLQEETLKITVPAHRPVKRTTLTHILKAAHLSLEEFKALL